MQHIESGDLAALRGLSLEDDITNVQIDMEICQGAVSRTRHNIYKSPDTAPCSDAFPAVVFIFPNNSNRKDVFLNARAHRTLRSLNTAINDRLKRADESTALWGTVKLAVACGKCLYRFDRLVGTLYATFAKHVIRQNDGDVANNVADNLLVLTNMSGNNRFLSFFLVTSEIESSAHIIDTNVIPIRGGSPLLIYESNTPIYVCESEPADHAEQSRAMRSVSYESGLAIARDPTKIPSSWIPPPANILPAFRRVKRVASSDTSSPEPTPRFCEVSLDSLPAAKMPDPYMDEEAEDSV